MRIPPCFLLSSTLYCKAYLRCFRERRCPALRSLCLNRETNSSAAKATKQRIELCRT